MFSNSWLGGFMRIGKAVIRWTRKRISTVTFICVKKWFKMDDDICQLTGPSQSESTMLPSTLSPRSPQPKADIGM